MSVKLFEIVYNGADLTAAGEVLDAFGRPFGFRVSAGTIKRIKIWSKRGEPNAAGDNVFNVKKNGAALYAGAARPKIAQNAESGEISGLTDVVAEGDELSLSLDTMAAGGVKAPIVLLVEIEDGETKKIEIGVAASDEATAITTGTAKTVFRAPRSFRLTEIRATLSTASTSGIPLVNVKKNGATIFGTNKLSIDANEKTSKTAATAANFAATPTDFADDDEIQIDVDTAGTGAKGLKIWFVGERL